MKIVIGFGATLEQTDATNWSAELSHDLGQIGAPVCLDTALGTGARSVELARPLSAWELAALGRWSAVEAGWVAAAQAAPRGEFVVEVGRRG